MGPFHYLIDTVLGIFSFVIIVWIVMGWLIQFGVLNGGDRLVGSIMDTCGRLVNPVLAPVRRYMPNLGGLDLSPLVVIIGIEFTKRFLDVTIFSWIPLL